MKFLLLLLFTLLFSCLNAQSFKLLQSYTKAFGAWDVDPLGFVVYSNADMIYKLDTNFTLQFKESFKTLGGITSIDAKHAQKTLVFSEDMQQIAFLDNTLTPTVNKKKLDDSDIELAKLVCFSQISSRYWVYDDINSKLIRFDQQFNKPIVIENLNLILSQIELLNMFEENNKLYLVSKNKGVFVFDNFGSLINKISIESTKAVRVVDDVIYYLTDNALIKQTLNGVKVSIELPETNILDFRVLGNYIYFKSARALKKYSLKLN